MQPISSSEAGWTGLLDRTTHSWDEELLDLLPIQADHLPPIRDYTSKVQGLASAYTEHWPELADVPFFLAVGDGAAANIGSGCTDPDRIALTIGTSGAIRIVVTTDHPGSIRVPPGLWVYPVDRTRQLVGGALTAGGSLYRWLRPLLHQ